MKSFYKFQGNLTARAKGVE